MIEVDVVIIGAGASGLMCAIEAGKRGRKVWVLDHANRAGKKILMSGGGRCNFTNYSISPEHYLSQNPHFCKSALSRYTQWDFLALIHQYQIPFHQREHGQLFCNDSAKDIVTLLLTECANAGVKISLNTVVEQIKQNSAQKFIIHTNKETILTQSLVIATGGLSIPKIGATPLGYQVAQQFGLPIIPTRAGLVPFTLQAEDKLKLAPLLGIALMCEVSNQRQSFKEAVLFTHRGLSGPAILQLSSYWQAGEEISINLLPELDLAVFLKAQRQQKQALKLKNLLAPLLPKRLIATLVNEQLLETTVTELADKKIAQVVNQLQQWTLKPNNTEGYRTAEVTLGGIDCAAISSKTMQSKEVAGLFFTGEVLDVTGRLGGYNFQWAWSSGWCAGQYV
jgi:predicted Rossmann fold flavoprotein